MAALQMREGADICTAFDADLEVSSRASDLTHQKVWPTEALQQMVAQGQVDGQSQVWKQGMPAWAALSAVPELAGLLSAGGPPPPPPPSA